MISKTAAFLLALLLFAGIENLFAQNTEKYNEGIAALQKNDTSAAKSYFKESIAKNRDAASFYELANIQYKINTHESRNLALENYKEAVERDPGNLDYRMAFASLKTEFSSFLGVKEFDKIKITDVNNIEDLNKAGKQFLYFYEKYKNMVTSKPGISYFDDAAVFYQKAESFFLKAIDKNKFFVDAVLGYARLVAAKGDFTLALRRLRVLNKNNPDIIEVNLFLGIIYHKLKNIPESLSHFEKAFSKMNETEKRVYEYDSVIPFFKPEFQQRLLKLSMQEQDAVIKKYWETKDPLYLSEENERLTEHYYRVTYSNFFFGSPRLNIPGWQSDRGKVFITFGEPVSTQKTTTRYAIVVDKWTYPEIGNITFDCLMYDNYKLSWIDRSWGGKFGTYDPSAGINLESMNTYESMMQAMFDNSVLSSPKQISVPMQMNVFKSLTPLAQNNVYFTYMLPEPESSNKKEHEYCIYIQNDKMEFESKKTGVVKKDFISKIDKENRPDYEKLNTLVLNIKPGRLNFAFETRTLRDSLVSSIHKEYNFPSFKKDSLDMSGLLLASKVHEGSPLLGAIKRKDIYILPKLGRKFVSTEPLYLYYEAYNLAKKTDGNTEFEHTITIKESDIPEVGIPFIKIYKSIAGFITGKSDEISLTTAYTTQEKDSQVYIQLDVSKYKPGKYDLSVVVNDKVTGEKVERKWQFLIVEK